LCKFEPFIEHRLDHEQTMRVAIGSVAVPNTAFQVRIAQPDRSLEHCPARRRTGDPRKPDWKKSAAQWILTQHACLEASTSCPDEGSVLQVLRRQVVGEDQDAGRQLAGDPGFVVGIGEPFA